MNPMTRQEAEGLGWRISLVELDEPGSGRWQAQAEKGDYNHDEREYRSPHLSQDDAVADALSAITAIERHADAERMLEECRQLLLKPPIGRQECEHMVAKLEARK